MQKYLMTRVLEPQMTGPGAICAVPKLVQRIPTLVMAACTLILSGCLFPEKFATKVDVNSDTSYHILMSGTAAYVPAVMQIASSKKPLSDKEERSLQLESERMGKAEGIKKVSYAGNGRFDIQIDAAKNAGQPSNIFDFFKVSTDKDGVMTISSPRTTDEDKKQLTKLGLGISGTLDVSLPRNAEVISSNATSSPMLFGLLGTHSWKIGSVDVSPMMKVRFKN
jgi:hypothetical protein